jgi:hypothetical protein
MRADRRLASVLVWEQEIGGSNPPAPTEKTQLTARKVNQESVGAWGGICRTCRPTLSRASFSGERSIIRTASGQGRLGLHSVDQGGALVMAALQIAHKLRDLHDERSPASDLDQPSDRGTS